MRLVTWLRDADELARRCHLLRKSCTDPARDTDVLCRGVRVYSESTGAASAREEQRRGRGMRLVTWLRVECELVRRRWRFWRSRTYPVRDTAAISPRWCSSSSAFDSDHTEVHAVEPKIIRRVANFRSESYEIVHASKKKPTGHPVYPTPRAESHGTGPERSPCRICCLHH